MSASVTVRMYNQKNLGDCFLLCFKEGRKTQYMLIDCGSYEGNAAREIEIAEDIKKTVKNSPLIIVLTHQHKDHLSGFKSAASIFSTMNIAEVWLSFLDDPKGKEAKKIREATEKFWNKDGKLTAGVKTRFGNVPKVKKMLAAKAANDLFAVDQSGGDSVRNLLDWCNGKPRFLKPGQWFSLPGLSDDAVRIYVLGPPTDETLLKKLNPTGDEAVHGLSLALMNLELSGSLILNALEGSSDGKDDFPFAARFRYNRNDSKRALLIQKSYDDKAANWRRIDTEWLSELGRLSLHMGNLTNNSSLVLAFELVKQEKVLLFVGDAQIGNWQSWANAKFKDAERNADDLLSRTVLYKAGHHSSHNATWSEGLDKMNEEELVIMIPVNEAVSSKNEFLMLKQGMMLGYNRKAKGRILRADTVYHKPKTGLSVFEHKFASRTTDFTPAIKLSAGSKVGNHLFVEYTIS